MKTRQLAVSVLLITILISTSCKHIFPPKESESSLNDTIAASDFTGVKRYMSSGKLIKEVTFLNGIKNGLCKNYYDDGRLKSTIWYANNFRSDTAKWYYPEGKVYRATPYTDDAINGIQSKYYKSGRLMAELPYIMGFRAPGLKEYYEDGRRVVGMPSIVAEVNQSFYESHGTIRVLVKLSNDSNSVDYYRGSLTNGAFDSAMCKKVTISSGMGFIELKTDKANGRGYVDVIAVYTTRFRNKEIITKRVKLPYNDLN